MVPLTPTDWLHARREALRGVVATSLADAPLHAEAFARRILARSDLPSGISPNRDVSARAAAVRYGGAPEAAALGFTLGGAGQDAPAALVGVFREAASRLQKRSAEGMASIAEDDLAVLGLADGVAGFRLSDRSGATTLARWLVATVEGRSASTSWARRLRELALDLLDERGRLRAPLESRDPELTALEVVLRSTWPGRFVGTPPPDQGAREALMKALLTAAAPGVGDLERAAVWLAALEAVVDQGALTLVPRVDDVVRVLESTQSALRRWVWEDRAGRSQVVPSRWLIDNEAHVQAFLWAALYPVFGAALRGEEYLRGYGLVQPRFDLAVADLKVIIELKIARRPNDFGRIEEEVAGDLGIYFADPQLFDHMVVYVYDDCDAPAPERYTQLRTALLARDPRIRGVVIVRRPSMIPDRDSRGS